MAIVEKLQPRSGPVGLASSDGYSWARLITGVFAVAISLTTSWRAGLIPVEQASTELPLPKLEQTTTANLIDRQETGILNVAAPPETLSRPASTAQVAPKPAARSSVSAKRHPHPRMTARVKAKGPSAKLRSNPFAPRKADVDPRSIGYNPVAHTQLTRSRAEVRNEYLAAREQVAALTGEDSGSAYLARQAARQSAARANLRARAASASDAGRRGRTT